MHNDIYVRKLYIYTKFHLHLIDYYCEFYNSMEAGGGYKCVSRVTRFGHY